MSPARAAVFLLLFVATALVLGVLWHGRSQDAGSTPVPPVPHRGSAAPGSADPDRSPIPDTLLALIPADQPKSPHPVESAVAAGEVLEVRFEPTRFANQWRRVRLVRSPVQPRLVRVSELWDFDPIAGRAICLSREMFLADQLIVKAAPGIDEAELRTRLEAAGMHLLAPLGEGSHTVRLDESGLDSIPEALRLLSGLRGLIESAEADGVGFGSGTPNDPRFSEQWGLHNTGQSGGTVNVDIDGPDLWDILEGTPGIVIGVLDSGLNFNHPDLQDIAWINPGETGNDGIDNDASGKIDDVRGWDFVNNDNDPTDDHAHGSHVTGILAANRSNGVGVAGLLGGVRILVCKILNSSNSGTTSNLIAATTYARQRGVPVMNLSLQNYPFSSALSTEFAACETDGIVLVACAGNQGTNNDVSPNYPSSHIHANVIAVGNHDRTDARWSGSFLPSNFGSTSVDLFAPGRDILAPVLGTAYSSYTGTSQATPFVTAVCAGLKFANPSWTAPQIKTAVLSSVVTRPAYDGICTTGGRLHAVRAVSAALRALPGQDSDGDGFSNLFEYLAGTRIDSRGSLPLVSSGTSAGWYRIQTSRKARGDALFEVETSDDLVFWSTDGVSDQSSPTMLSRGIPVDGAATGFLRIRAVPLP